MTAALQARPARPQDTQIIAEFNCQLARETEDVELDPAIVLRGVGRLLENPTAGFYTVAELEGQVVGCLLITFEWSDWRDGWVWWIQSVYVDASARRQGVFRLLFDHIRCRAEKDPEVRGLRLYVERENDSAQSTYASLGMSESHYRIFEMATSAPGT